MKKAKPKPKAQRCSHIFGHDRNACEYKMCLIYPAPGLRALLLPPQLSAQPQAAPCPALADPLSARQRGQSGERSGAAPARGPQPAADALGTLVHEQESADPAAGLRNKSCTSYGGRGGGSVLAAKHGPSCARGLGAAAEDNIW